MTLKLKDITINVEGNIAVDYDETTKTVRVYETYPRYTYYPYYPYSPNTVTWGSNQIGSNETQSPYPYGYNGNTGGQLGG